MTFALWSTLFIACVVISLTPGAGAVNTMGNALTAGFRRSIWGILGQQAALVVHIAIVAAGVGVLVTTTPAVFEFIRYAGAAYLVYLGVRQMLTKPRAVADDEASTDLREPRWSMFRRGFLVNILNPKAIVFFLAFLPQFIRLDEPLLPQYLVVTATVLVVDIAVMWGVFAVAAHAVRRYTRSVRGQRVLSIVFGCLFIALGLALALIH